MTPYRLGYLDGHILACAPAKILRQLLTIPGAADLTQDTVSLPASRLTFMAAEAIGAPERVSPQYREARRRALQPVGSVSLAGCSLLEHQRDFLSFAHEKRGVLNASEQGTGKTRMAWALHHLWHPQRTLIVCPKSLTSQWFKEQQIMWDTPPIRDLRLFCLNDGAIERRRAQIRQAATLSAPAVVILNYEVLARLLPEIRKFAPDCLIFDESYRLKNRQAAVTKTALKLVKGHTARVLLLSGTPVGNDVGDLWSQLAMLMPMEPWALFVNQYAEMARVPIAGRTIMKPRGLKDAIGLMERLDPVWFRATKESCLTLPPKQYHRITLAMPLPTRALYRQVQEHGSTALGAPGCLDGEATSLLRLQQLTGGVLPLPLDDRGREWTAQPLPCPKLEWLEALARDRLAGNPTARLLVWCRFLPEVQRITASLREILGDDRVTCATGKTDNDALETMKESFNSRDADGVQVIVCQIQKMHLGHNLQSTDYNVFFSHSWSYVERVQAEDRSHRQGRQGAIDYYDLVLKDSIDQDIMQAMARKTDLAVRTCPSTA